MGSKMTLLELFASAYLTPQEISIEARLPIETVYQMRDGKPVPEYAVKRVLHVVSSRLGRRIALGEIQGVRLLD